MPGLIFDECLLPAGWAREVGVDIEGGAVQAVTAGASGAGRQRVTGIALPGLTNLHCHTFQRGMAGLTEWRGQTADNFWTWREIMYQFLDALTPDDIEAIAAFAYMQMLERGFTAVAEFHYLHHDPAGRPYADLAETAARIIAAASTSGIGLTLLPSFYAYSTFDGSPPLPGQRQFINTPERFAELYDKTTKHLRALPHAAMGIAPHSLRAVTPATLREVLQVAPAGPIHMHVAEQIKEVDDCMAWCGARPVEWMMDNFAIDSRWCLIHATHMTEAETAALARSGAVAGLCPLTEANLGDGIFNAARFRAHSGCFGIGTDSQIEITAPGELKQLEYSQRPAHRARNILAGDEAQSTGRTLYEAALRGGAQATGRPTGQIAPGCRADFVVLDRQHPDLAAAADDTVLDAYIFTAGISSIQMVIVGGLTVVERGEHYRRSEITQRYLRVMAKTLGRTRP